MEIKEVISNVEIYGIENAMRGSRYPMAVDLSNVSSEIGPRQIALAQSGLGQGHDNYLNGIIVQFDLTFTNKAWVEAERYHFLDFISSQSTMHRIAKFDLDNSYIKYVDHRMIDIMKEKVKRYNRLVELRPEVKIQEYEDEIKEAYLEILYSNPAGFRLTAKMTTNYRQLKTIYHQRRTHRLPEWQAFCDWVETLPHPELITKKSVV